MTEPDDDLTDLPPFEPTEADMLGTAYGVTGCTIGEDGEWVLLGHVEPRKALAAVVRIARDRLALRSDDVFGYRPWVTWHDLYPTVQHQWAVFTHHPDFDWWCRVDGVTTDTPGAVPITYINP